jgi:hypothetical protein
MGGRDVPPASIKKVFEYAFANDAPEGQVIWLDLKE